MAENRPKPGSLRDRIAAFESQNKNKSSDSGSGAPPPPRPKPAHLNREWKPIPRNDDDAEEKEKKERPTSGMSASDAKESIQTGGFGSLKERMAALQGRGGFSGAGMGAPAPPTAPKPALPKKVVSPPPAEEGAVSPPTPEGEVSEASIIATAGDSEVQSPPEVSQSESNADDSQEKTEEDEEQARRAAIAARMARLGGTRFGMAPPVFGRKPPVPAKKPSMDAQEAPAATSPAEEQPESRSAQATSPTDIPLSTSPPVPSSGGLLVGPKRAAPPRKKRSTPTSVSSAEKEATPTPEGEVKPEEVALPPSRSTTLDVGQATPSSEEPVPMITEEEAKEPEGTTASPEPIDPPFGHMRLQSIASEVETEEIATPPPRSATPTSGDEEDLPLEEPEEVPSPVTPDEASAVDDFKEENTEPALSPKETETPSQIASRVDVSDSMEDTQLTPSSPTHHSEHEEEEKPRLEKEKDSAAATADREEDSDLGPTHGQDVPILDAEIEGIEDPENDQVHRDQSRSGYDEGIDRDNSVGGDLTEESDVPYDDPSAPQNDKDEPAHEQVEIRSQTLTQEPEEVISKASGNAVQEEETEETARRQRIAEKMKKLGGFNPFGSASQQQQSRKTSVGSPSDEKSEPSATSPSDAQTAEGEEDEAARRRRIAEKMSKMGGFNPFGAPMPPRKAVDPVLPDEQDEPVVEETHDDHPYEHEATPEEEAPSWHEQETADQEEIEDTVLPPPVPVRTYSRPIPPTPTSEPADPVLDSEGEEFETPQHEEEEEEEVAPPVPQRMNRPIPPPPPHTLPEPETEAADEEEEFLEEEEEEEDPPPVPQRIHRPIPPPPPEESSEEQSMLAMDETPPTTPKRSSRDVPPIIEDEDADDDEDDREGASTPIPRRTSFMDFSEEAEEYEAKEEEQPEEEAPPPPPARRPPVPVPQTKSVERQAQNVRSASKSPPPMPPHRAAPAVPPVSTTSRLHAPSHSVMSISDLPHLSPSYEDQPGEPYEPFSDDEEHPEGISATDPIDPMLHPAPPANTRRASLVEREKQAEFLAGKRASTDTMPARTSLPPVSRSPPPPPPPSAPTSDSPNEEDEEGARRRTIAERMARLGGIKFGTAPPIPSARRQQSSRQAQAESPPTQDESEPLNAEAESERRRAIASRLAGQGQLGRGMFGAPMHVAPSAPKSERESSQPPARTTTEDELQSSMTSIATSDLTESEVLVSRAEMVPDEEAPPVPSRGLRKPTSSESPPPPPSRIPPHAPQRTAPPMPSQSSPPLPPPMKSTPSDFVVVSSMSSSFSTSPPSLPPPTPGQADLTTSRSLSETWELPSIPLLSIDFDSSSSGDIASGVGAGLGVGSESQTSRSRSMDAGVSEDSTKYPNRLSGLSERNGHLQESSSSGSSVTAAAVATTATREELDTLVNKLNGRIVQSASQLYSSSSSKSKNTSSSGESSTTSLGFLNKVLSSVLDARSPIPYKLSPSSPPPLASSSGGAIVQLTPFGYPIYSHSVPPSSSSQSQTQAGAIQPGDIILFTGCHFQGRKGLQSYNIHIGSSSPSTSRSRSDSRDSRKASASGTRTPSAAAAAAAGGGGGGDLKEGAVFGIINEVEKRHFKVKVFLSLDGVSVENNGYRLEELKAGSVEVFRVPEASYVL